ncbi:type IVB secretion system protein IcmH/DotU [Marinobacterium aestuariivivens]|uniref:Type IVB secretion system protein IcmH/DotU n=1 Tax=Marinobacterium aestuariivivens TaxID=1698799 RepID=A0ABW1ZZU1_9GAMM
MTMDYLDEATVEVAQGAGAPDETRGNGIALAATPVLKYQRHNLESLQAFDSSENRLLNAGAELLSLCVTIPRMPRPDDLHRFRQELRAAITDLKRRIAALDYPASVADKSCFLFCIVLDELILHCDWGESCGWENQTLLSELFGMRDGGEQFYRVADKALGQPNLLLDLLELIYVFLKIGFRGQYRLSGRERLDALYLQIETVVLRNRPQSRFNGCSAAELPPPRKPARRARFGRQLLLFAAAVGIAWGGVGYWYGQTFEARAEGFTGLAEFSRRQLDEPEDREVVYVSTPDEMQRSARGYGAPEQTATPAPQDGESHWVVQLATFDQRSQATAFLQHHGLEALGARVEPWNALYRVLATPADRQQARQLLQRAQALGIDDAFIITNR